VVLRFGHDYHLITLRNKRDNKQPAEFGIIDSESSIILINELKVYRSDTPDS
jgi:hypothetical protein